MFERLFNAAQSSIERGLSRNDHNVKEMQRRAGLFLLLMVAAFLGAIGLHLAAVAAATTLPAAAIAFGLGALLFAAITLVFGVLAGLKLIESYQTAELLHNAPYDQQSPLIVSGVGSHPLGYGSAGTNDPAPPPAAELTTAALDGENEFNPFADAPQEGLGVS